MDQNTIKTGDSKNLFIQHGVISSGQDLNELVETGTWRISNSNSPVNNPLGGSGYLVEFKITGNYDWQMATANAGSNLYMRGKTGDTTSWSDWTQFAKNDSLTDGTVSKVGTSTIGSTTHAIYLNAGVPTSLSGTRGSTTEPLYLNSGSFTACSAMLRLSGDTMTGLLYAQTNTSYTTYQVRNIAFTTSTPSSLTNGYVCMVYS